MTEPMTFGEAVRRVRLAQGLTQIQLAEYAVISKGMISMIETGHRTPSYVIAERLVDALDPPHWVRMALLSMGGYASRFVQEAASLEIRAYLNSLDAPGDENKAPPRVIEGYTGIPLPRTPQRG